jgi:predicted NAD/FAD-binding protein
VATRDSDMSFAVWCERSGLEYSSRAPTASSRSVYCVTLNPDGGVAESHVLRRFVYRHRLYTREAIRAQQRWREVSGVNRTHYCGAYWTG